ncbi:MAG: polysaccharide deacetylase family protein [Anaerolineales bacterium]
MKIRIFHTPALSIILFFAAACSPQAPLQTPVNETLAATSASSQTSMPTALPPTLTEEPTTSPTKEPPAPPPDVFTSEVLRAGIEPVSYLTDQCAYLAQRWDPAGAVPGAVVAPIMFHSILKSNETPTLSQDINKRTFNEIMSLAKELGYETITSQELLDFLLNNAKIPERSMILILDDRRPGTAEDYFLPYLEENDWTLTLAWIAVSDTAQRPGKLQGESLWDWMERLNDTGYFDIQSHGRDHIYLNADTPRQVVRREIEGSINPLKQHFGNTPIAYIWPGGNFTPLGVQIARDAGFELGFTIQARGPLQFNWIPQGEQEREYNDPLMLLPRYWDTAALLNLEQAAQIGDAAQAFARENYAAEAAWFSQNCDGELPELNEVFKQ